MPNTEGWVGTWRPHKPKGPIAALYGSPGPVYALPGLTGSSKHDPTKFKAPMFSFGVRLEEENIDHSPGPIYLIPSNVTRQGQGNTPTFSFQGRPQDIQVYKTPGPGKYSPEKSEKWVFHSSPAYSLNGRPRDEKKNETPGPAAHTLPPVFGSKTVNKPAAPCYSISRRTKNGAFEVDPKTPGPATYKVVDLSTYMQKSPHYSMAGRNFIPDDATQKPGPGAHYPEKVSNTKPKAPSFSFGLRHSQYIAPFIENQSE